MKVNEWKWEHCSICAKVDDEEVQGDGGREREEQEEEVEEGEAEGEGEISSPSTPASVDERYIPR